MIDLNDDEIKEMALRAGLEKTWTGALKGYAPEFAEFVALISAHFEHENKFLTIKIGQLEKIITNKHQDILRLQTHVAFWERENSKKNLVEKTKKKKGSSKRVKK